MGGFGSPEKDRGFVVLLFVVTIYFFLDGLPQPLSLGVGVGIFRPGSDLTSTFTEPSFLWVWYCVPPGWIFPWIALYSLSQPMPYFLIRAACDTPFSNSARQAWLIRCSSPRVCKACIAALLMGWRYGVGAICTIPTTSVTRTVGNMSLKVS